MVTFLALKNCMNVCPDPQKLYNSQHMDMNLQRETVSHIHYLVYHSNGLENLYIVLSLTVHYAAQVKLTYTSL